MKRIKHFYLSIIIFLTVFLISTKTVAVQSYAPGELLKYNIRKMGMKVGEATIYLHGFEKYKDKTTILIVFTAKATNFYDEEKIYLDPITFLPLFVERDINVFGRKEQISEVYLPNQNRIRITKRVGKKETVQEIIKKGYVENIYGFIYRYRRDGTFALNKKMLLTLPTKDVSIECVRKEAWKSNSFAKEVYVLQTIPNDYSVWFSADDKRIPLRIDSIGGMGQTSLVLKSYKE